MLSMFRTNLNTNKSLVVCKELHLLRGLVNGRNVTYSSIGGSKNVELNGSFIRLEKPNRRESIAFIVLW